MDIKELDKAIEEFVKNEVEYIKSYGKNKNDIKSKMFSKGYTLYGIDYQDKGYEQVKGVFGIYIIYMNEEVFLDEKTVYNFNESAKGGKFKTYKSYDLKEGTCIYLGSCVSESLYSRLNQHFKDSGNCYSLHLKNKNREILKNKIRIVAFPEKSSGFYANDILLKKIEQELHNNLKPTNGSNMI